MCLKERFSKLLFLGSTLFEIRKKLKKLFSGKLTSSNLKIIFTSPVRVKSFFTFKDKLPKMLLLGLVSKHRCGGCNATYNGKTKHYFEVRICECLGTDLFFFFYQGYLSQTLTIHRTAGEGRGSSFIPLYHFHPLMKIEAFTCNLACEMTITYF